MKPLLLLDIDGVLCPFGRDGKYLKGIPDYQQMDDHPGWWSPDHTEMLQELSKLYEIVWATMWMDDANDVISPLHGLERLPFVVFDRIPENKTFKLPAVSRFIEDRPVAWIDDDLFEDAYEWAAERHQTIPTKLVHTWPAHGLGEQEMSELRLFAYELKENQCYSTE